MSIVESLKKLFDPNQQRLEEKIRAEDREAPRRDDEGDDTPRFQCRICRATSPKKAFCMTCLADTMDPIKP